MADSMDEEVLGYMSGYAGGAGAWAANTVASGDKADAAAGADELLAANKRRNCFW